ncbi:MAG TPA: N-acetylmuramic acid 6-phosphate etherase [Alphaproteobacteria bacterium]|nr:N-acetylmuramic acid 6-phosphate etherase [Alphaproteobacteria bacterium]
MSTEAFSPRYLGLDAWPSVDVLGAMVEGQFAAIAAVQAAIPAIAAAAEAAAARLRGGGRIAYAGAGTSGRLAVLDGAELRSTFSWPLDRVLFLMAGGADRPALPDESAEDDAAAGSAEAARLTLGSADVVVSVAASGTTPYTLAVQAAARAAGALTIAIANNPGRPLLLEAEFPILLDTGPEVIGGSTRMKAGTAQKAALNLLSSLTMLRLGGVHDGMMVDLDPTNAKLAGRARRIVAQAAGCTPEAAARALAATSGRAKPAVLVALGLSAEAADAALAASGGHLRAALAALAEGGRG